MNKWSPRSPYPSLTLSLCLYLLHHHWSLLTLDLPTYRKWTREDVQHIL
jgi:hypothetical protein